MELEQWLAASHGVVRRRDLVALGVSDAEIRKRVRAGEWQRAFRGVILAAVESSDSTASDRCRAALVAAGPGAYLSCLGAARHLGLPVPQDAPVHVSIPVHRVARRAGGFRAHRNASEQAPCSYGGLPTVPVELALIQSFGCLADQRKRRALVIESVRSRLVAIDRVVDASRPGTDRRPELFELLALCGGSESEAEIAMLLLMRGARLPEPVRQHRLASGTRSYRLDLAYPDALLAIEVDGKAWHFNAHSRNADIQRDAQLAADGWLTIRFTYEQIAKDPGWVIGCIRSALARRNKIG